MDVDVLELHSLSAPHLKARLEALKEANKELNFRAAKVLEHLNEFTSLNQEKAAALKQKILDLNIPRLKDKHADKILDIMPTNVEEIKALFSGENITLKQEDLTKLLNTLKE
ncbi:MAG TPA: hypothetical protein VFE88_03135 [Candidatus Nanoarchaeia archaeon]|nr:hypothetical protein [Candidatus Nanoarchaeia archaeon]